MGHARTAARAADDRDKEEVVIKRFDWLSITEVGETGKVKQSDFGDIPIL